jgi:tetratricopeptide (TPR) repeat protein
VSENGGMLRHLAFFEALGKMNENDSSWRAVSAGLVVMRLVDQWIEDGPRKSRVDTWAVGAVRESIAQVADTTPVRRILTSIVDAMVSTKSVDLHVVCPRLMAYGQALEYEARWAIAADVYQTILAHAHPLEDADLTIGAHLQVAFCYRTLGELDAASAMYAKASQIASSVNDLIGVLRGRLGDAKIAMARGNLPHADALVGETIKAAEANNLTEIRSRALGERSYIAGLRGQYDRLIRYAYESLELAPAQRDRDRNLNNIATAFRFLGLVDVARDSYLVLAATAEEQYVRWIAGLNLMELAAEQRSELQFEQHRREYESVDFTPILRVTYLLHVGRGYHTLGRASVGIPYLQQAIEVASQHQLNQLMFEAEGALAAARRDETRVVTKTATAHIDDELRSVIDAIQDLKEMAGVA